MLKQILFLLLLGALCSCATIFPEHNKVKIIDLKQIAFITDYECKRISRVIKLVDNTRGQLIIRAKNYASSIKGNIVLTRKFYTNYLRIKDSNENLYEKSPILQHHIRAIVYSCPSNSLHKFSDISL